MRAAHTSSHSSADPALWLILSQRRVLSQAAQLGRLFSLAGCPVYVLYVQHLGVFEIGVNHQRDPKDHV